MHVFHAHQVRDVGSLAVSAGSTLQYAKAFPTVVGLCMLRVGRYAQPLLLQRRQWQSQHRVHQETCWMLNKYVMRCLHVRLLSQPWKQSGLVGWLEMGVWGSSWLSLCFVLAGLWLVCRVLDSPRVMWQEGRPASQRVT